MIIQITTDNNVSGNEDFIGPFREKLHAALSRFSERVTSFQVHLGDENAGKEGDRDKRCVIEARIEGKPPIAVTCHEGNFPQAVKGAITKIKGALDTTLSKQRQY